MKNIIGNMKNFALIVSGNCNITKESYEDGELGYVNSYNMDGKYYILKDTNEILDKIKDYLIKNGLLFDAEKYWIYEGKIETDKLTDAKGYELMESEYEDWKDGKFEAYNNHYSFNILINGNNISSNDLFELLGKKIKVED